MVIPGSGSSKTRGSDRAHSRALARALPIRMIVDTRANAQLLRQRAVHRPISSDAVSRCGAGPARRHLPLDASRSGVRTRGDERRRRESDGTFTVAGGARRGHLGDADAFGLPVQTLTGDGTIVPQGSRTVRTVNAWTKAGVMIRESLNAGRPQHIQCWSHPGKGLAVRVARDSSGTSLSAAGAPDGSGWSAPVGPVTASVSIDGSSSLSSVNRKSRCSPSPVFSWAWPCRAMSRVS